ncbi:preprotein translocase subunit SecE [Candidatus Daviesbacteria bacterium]|nr:preprotein translocase subunit SecE [Candidatus Daviesbacteria bacterium]
MFMKPLDFLRTVKVELDKVVWPTRDQTIKLTTIVILVTLIVGFFIGGIDLLLTKLTELLLNR